MEERTVQRAEVKASIYNTKEKDQEVKRPEIGLVVDGKDLKYILLISKSNAMDLAKGLNEMLKKIL